MILPIVILLGIPGTTMAQLLADPNAVAVARQMTGDLYRYKFKGQAGYRQQLAKLGYERHPVIPMAEALEIYWRYFPVVCNEPKRLEYLQLLDKVITQAQPLIDNPANHQEGTFFRMMALLMTANSEGDAGNSVSAVNHARKAYSLVREGFKYTEKVPEFYFTSGLYNYFRVYYPEQNPVYRPFMSFFAQGDKELGKKQLREAAEKSVFTSAEALFFLARVLSSAEENNQASLVVTTELVDKYPSNPAFNTFYIADLVALGRESEALKILAGFPDTENPFIATVKNVYKGICYHRLGKPMDETKALLQAGIASAGTCNHAGLSDYEAMAKLELAVIAKEENQLALSRTLARQVHATSRSSKLKARAKALL